MVEWCRRTQTTGCPNACIDKHKSVLHVAHHNAVATHGDRLNEVGELWFSHLRSSFFLPRSNSRSAAAARQQPALECSQRIGRRHRPCTSSRPAPVMRYRRMAPADARRGCSACCVPCRRLRTSQWTSRERSRARLNAASFSSRSSSDNVRPDGVQQTHTTPSSPYRLRCARRCQTDAAAAAAAAAPVDVHLGVGAGAVARERVLTVWSDSMTTSKWCREQRPCAACKSADTRAD